MITNEYEKRMTTESNHRELKNNRNKESGIPIINRGKTPAPRKVYNPQRTHDQ